METFPTLSQNPDAEGYGENIAGSPTLVGQFESGNQVTRPKYTVVPEVWKFNYRYLSAADKLTLKTFYRTVKYTADAFNWTNTLDEIAHVARFNSKIIFTLENTQANEWRADIELIEFNPASP